MSDGWSSLWRPPAHGELVDAGYQEFFVAVSFAEEVELGGAVSVVNGRRVHVKRVAEYPEVGMVQFKWFLTRDEVELDLRREAIVDVAA